MSDVVTSAEVEQSSDGLRSEVAQRADFSEIRYSQSWEDPTCLERALHIEASDRVLSIAAAGDNSFALLLMGDGPERVVSVDLNPAQVALVHLKVAAIRTLDHPDLLRFLGVTAGTDRVDLYSSVRDELDADAKHWWDSNTELISRGVTHTGKLERYYGMYRRYVLGVTHSKRQVRALFEPRDAVERAIFYDETFMNRRYATIIRVFLSKTVLGRFGRDPAFFEHVDIPSVADHYMGRTRHASAVLDPMDNWFLQYVMLGDFLDPERAHPYLAEAALPVLRDRLDRLEVHCAELEGFLGSQPRAAFTKFNLSDIFEWMSDELYEQMLRALVRTSEPGGRLAYWNNMVLRSRPDTLSHVLEPERELAREIHLADRAFFYRDFQVERIIAVPEDL